MVGSFVLLLKSTKCCDSTPTVRSLLPHPPFFGCSTSWGVIWDFSDFQNHVAFRAIFRPEYEGYIRNTIYRCEKDGQTQILVISDFWIFNFCHTDFCKPFSWIFNFCKKSNNQKTARTKSRFSQQPSKLGIEVGGVLKTKNRAEQLLFYALN